MEHIDSAALREEYDALGAVRQCFELSNTEPLAALASDVDLFEEKIAKQRNLGLHTVTYFTTPSIEKTLHDPNLNAVVSALLDDPNWVMWGANIRRNTPNEAGAWHVDAESLLWPSLTVAVGVQNCYHNNSTRLLTATHMLPFTPHELENPKDNTAVEQTAVEHLGSDASIIAPTGFGCGKFYVFNAKTWHAGQAEYSNGRIVLFMHFHKASDPRIPKMLDYRDMRFSQNPVDFVPAPGLEEHLINACVASKPSSGRPSLRERIFKRFR